MRRPPRRHRALFALVLSALLLTACTEDDPAPRPAGAATEATATSAPTEPASVTPTPTWTPAPQPPLEELYHPRPYQQSASDLSREYIPTRIPPPTLDAANAEAALWLDEHAYTGVLPAAFEDVAGSERRECVEVGELQRVRSGDFVLDVSEWAAPDFVFQLIPASEHQRRLLIRAVQIDNGDPATHVHEYDGRFGPLEFTPTFVLPVAGRWLVTVTAGPLWGCFLLDAPEPPGRFAAVPSVTAAEAAGAAFASEEAPSLPSPGFTQDRGPDVIGRVGPVGGTADRNCVPANDYWDARSGDWVIRPAMQYTSAWDPMRGSKVILIPLHQPPGLDRPDDRDPDLERLLFTSTLLDDPRHTYAYEAPRLVAYTGSEAAGTLEFSHVTSFMHPRAGRWVSIATQGPNWGCFVFDLE